MKRLNLQDKKIGDAVVIGDTGKNDKNGNQIVLVRDKESSLHEVLASTVKAGNFTGYKGSKKQREDLRIINERQIFDPNIMHKNNKSGYKGVFFDKSEHRWLASLTFKKKRVLYKYFSTKEEAIAARKQAEKNILNKGEI